MSVRPFEEFVVSHFLKHSAGHIKPGFKYQFKSPDLENSKKLYRAFSQVSAGRGFIDVIGTKLMYVDCGGTRLLPVIQKEEGPIGYTENFISFLRDEVSSQKGAFANTALLIVHNSMLDTLINSAEDITAPGSIFDPERIKASLAELIETTELLDAHAVTKILLDYQYDLIVDDEGSMFGFGGLHDAIADGKICFYEINLIEDPAILSMQANQDQIRKRLDKNRSFYDEFEYVTQHYPNQLRHHLSDFSENFLRQHFETGDPSSWKKTLTLDAVLSEIEKNQHQQLVLVSETSATGKLLVRTKSSSKAAQRERHIIIEADEARSDFDFEVTFTGGKINKEEIKFSTKSAGLSKGNIQLSGGHKNSALTLTGLIFDEPLFFDVSLDRSITSECFKFRCLIVKKGWFNVDALANAFVINPSKKIVLLQTQDTELAIGLQEVCSARREIEAVDEIFNVNDEQVLDFEGIANEVETISFSIANGKAMLKLEIEGAAASDRLRLPLIFDLDRGSKLFKDEFFGVFNRTKQRVYIENKEVQLDPNGLLLLNREADWIESKTVASLNGKVISVDALKSLVPTLGAAYESLYLYIEEINSLPSLMGWGIKHQGLVKSVVDAFLAYMEAIKPNQYLDDTQKLILKIGFADSEGEECITPFHPLVLAYYLNLTGSISKDESNSFLLLPAITLERLNPQGLLPYLYNDNHDFSYVKANRDNAFWMNCVPYQNANYNYVVRLVREKICEFVDSFDCLFPKSSGEVRPTLIINTVNNHKNYEVFLGVVDHFVRERNQSPNIHVNIYDDEFSATEFDVFSTMANYESIKRNYGLNSGKAKDYADTIVDLLRTRLTYSKFLNSATDSQQYAHLTFFRNNQKVEVVDVNPEEKLSGICSHGLISGEASSNEKGNYITGFGTGKLSSVKNRLIDFSLMYSRLIKPSRKGVCEYRENSAIALAVNERFKVQLQKSYDSSIWTTIIDPKVTLDFFENTKNMLLIHYSDQYTSSAGYDAITVTRQTELYNKVLEKDDGGLVSEFNAFNGEWLLKLITDAPKIRKERKGILAAYKLVSILLAKSDITWVPLSVAEMIRVSGNIGLNISESEFSRHLNNYRSGAISDDVLFVGFKGTHVYLLPLEVKTGFNYDAVKAVKQSLELSRYLTELLSGDTFAATLYRSLFTRQVLMQVEKFELYNVYENDYFLPLTQTKEWWLQGDYSIAAVSNYPSGFVVANIENDKCFATSTKLTDNVLVIEVPASFMKATISTPLQVLLEDYKGTAAASIPSLYFLGQTTPNLSTIHVEKSEVAGESNSIMAPLSEESDSIPDVTPPVQIAQSYDSKAADEHLKVLIGHDVNHQSQVYWEPTNTAKFMNTNSGIIGTMGTGKTQCTKSVVTQLHRNEHLNVDGKPIGMLIFDYKSDYVDDKFIAATNAKKYNLHRLPYNPLSLFGDTPMLPVHTARGFSETMAKAFGLGQKQQLRLRKLISDAYDLAGISKSDSNTWSKPAPTIADVWALFIDQEKVEEDSLYAALETLAELEVFETDVNKCTSLYELVDGIRIIELARYSPQVQNLVVALTLDLFYSQMQKEGKPEVRGDFRQITKMVLVDEADNFMSQDFPSLRKILKEGREYGVGVILSTQDITHFKTKENDYSAYVLSWVVHRVSQISNQDIKSLFNKDDKSEQEYLMKSIRELEKHQSLYVNGDKKITKIKDLAFWQL
jgi:DNA phosphorothioation-dependent restriction protein DptH